MFKEVFNRRRKPLSELILETTCELGKCYSRLELASSKLEKRSRQLLETCSLHLEKGCKSRATVYASEIAEIRKVLGALQYTQLAVERVILRLDTFKTVSPTFEALQGIFTDVKNAAGLVAEVMPSVTPEIEELNTVIGEILHTSQLDMTVTGPILTDNASAQAILQEAADVVEQDLQKRIPEPPEDIKPHMTVKPPRPLIALSTDGSEVYVSEDGSIVEDHGSSSASLSFPDSLLEELVMNYVERNNGDMNVAKCVKELNVDQRKVYAVLDSLSRKGKIKIE